jgi:hypothetical protein
MTEQSTRDELTDPQLVDGIVYLASLVSNPQTIDPALDTLRRITASWDRGTSLDVEQRKTLRQITTRLKDYLIHHDPIRHFTPESLERRLWARLHSDAKHQGLLNFWSTTSISLGLGAIIMALPLTPSLLHRFFLAIPVFLTSVAVFAVWFYLTALRNFRPELKVAFRLLSAGIVMVSVQFSQFALVPFASPDQARWYQYGDVFVLIWLAQILYYLGLRKYAQLLKIKSIVVSLKFFTGVMLVGVLLVAAAAVLLHMRDPMYYIISISCIAGVNLASLLGAIVAYLIARHLTTIYAQSMRWYYIFLGSVWAGTLFYGVIVTVMGGLSGDAVYGMVGLLAGGPALLMLYTGYWFKRETSR